MIILDKDSSTYTALLLIGTLLFGLPIKIHALYLGKKDYSTLTFFLSLVSDFSLFAIHIHTGLISVASIYAMATFIDLWQFFLVVSGVKWQVMCGWVAGFYLVEMVLVRYALEIYNSGECLVGFAAILLLPQIIQNSRGSEEGPSLLLATALLEMNSLPLFLISCFRGHLILALTLLCVNLLQVALFWKRISCQAKLPPFDYKTPVPQLKSANQIVVENAVQPGEIVCCHCFNPVNLQVWPVRWSTNTTMDEETSSLVNDSSS